MESIKDRIKRLRKYKDVSQESIAAAWGMSQQAVGKKLNKDDESFSIGDLREIAKVLDVPVTALIFPPEDLALLSSPDPVVAPIYAEVERIKNMVDREKADSYLAAIL